MTFFLSKCFHEVFAVNVCEEELKWENDIWYFDKIKKYGLASFYKCKKKEKLKIDFYRCKKIFIR